MSTTATPQLSGGSKFWGSGYVNEVSNGTEMYAVRFVAIAWIAAIVGCIIAFSVWGVKNSACSVIFPSDGVQIYAFVAIALLLGGAWVVSARNAKDRYSFILLSIMYFLLVVAVIFRSSYMTTSGDHHSIRLSATLSAAILAALVTGCSLHVSVIGATFAFPALLWFAYLSLLHSGEAC
jgi:hypothetical protein